ncbi:tyrosine-type recombinase/integrase [uncultured Cohaesibacter sp.]|uniref:tyrosine-type recombinase/integrase n=1 Tax=uncultured Cohaesibacter sp. TaxID=1002546 RepID=UPI0029C82972|nr:tyrosine-type recombinase/integrase [uncultured Cohaesibacter sp.]
MNDKPYVIPKSRAKPGTFDWLIEQYMKTKTFKDIGPVYKRNLSLEMERFRKDHGQRSVTGIKKRHVEALMEAKRETPAAANKLKKLIGRLCRYAINDLGYAMTDPTQGVKPFKTNGDGYHKWTDAEISQFLKHHGEGSLAAIVLHLILYTGAARQDVNRMGWHSIYDNRIFYNRGKTGELVDLPLHAKLEEFLINIPSHQKTFITQTKSADESYTTESFGNWFGDSCKEAGVPGSAHGLRKAGATKLAEAGGTEYEVMTFLGHKTPQEARKYVKAANRKKMADNAMARLK